MSNFDLLDRYFSNELDKGELKAFNERLKNDPEFNQEFQEIKEIKLAVKVEARKEIKSLFTDLEDDLNQKESTNNNQTAMKKVYMVAASLMLIASVGYLVLTGNGKPSSQDVFTEYYQPYNNLNGQVRGEARAASMSAEAYNAYYAGNYALAAEKFEALVEVEKTAENYFYMGIANIEAGNYETAVKNLNTTLNNFTTYKDQSKWYLSMALLGADKEEEALSSLASLSSRRGAYKSRSSEVLEAMGYNVLESETTAGEAGPVVTHPIVDSPDGSNSTLNKRKYQFGEVIELPSGDVYKFHNESPIEGLGEGDLVEFIILKKAKGKKSKGFAFILDKVM